MRAVCLGLVFSSSLCLVAIVCWEITRFLYSLYGQIHPSTIEAFRTHPKVGIGAFWFIVLAGMMFSAVFENDNDKRRF